MIGKTTENGDRDEGTLSRDSVTILPPPIIVSDAPDEKRALASSLHANGARDAEALPSEDPIALLGTAAHPLSTPPTAFDIVPPPLPESARRPQPKRSERTLAHGIMLAGAALILTPVFLGFSTGRGDSTGRAISASAVLPNGGVSPLPTGPMDRLDAPEAPVNPGTEAPVQIPPLVIESRDPLAAPSSSRAEAAGASVRHASASSMATIAKPHARGTERAFDFSAAMNAVAATPIGMAQCGPEAVGVVPITITFAPDGRATRAVIEGGALRGTPVGSCVANALRGVKVPPFDGDIATLRTTVILK